MMTDSDRQMRQAAEDRQIRMAAESIFNASINSQRSSYTQNLRTPDTVNEVLIAGTRYNGRMSNVRRFFCLFVTFDLLFTILMWLICIMISGANVKMAFVEEITHYQMKTSLFDVVMAATSRFTVLLLFYALLYMNHWCIVALSTASTCAFLLAKVFLYDWSQSNQPVFQVLLILTSFVLVWGEVWFLDIKVIPQELQARDWYLGYSSERDPLFSPSAVVAAPLENAPFYTPIDSPDHSDDEETISRRRGGSNSSFLPTTVAIKLPQDKIEECKKRAPILLKKCYDLIISKDWKFDKVTSEGDFISHMVLPIPDGKIFKITGTIDTTAMKLIDSLFYNIESSPSWNKQINEIKKICVIDDNTDLIYNTTNTFANGAIGARDFVLLRHRGQHDSYFISSAVSVNFTGIPNRKNFIRGENGVCCFATRSLPNEGQNKCQFVWILNTNLKLKWIPKKVVEMSMYTNFTEFMSALRLHAITLKD